MGLALQIPAACQVCYIVGFSHISRLPVWGVVPSNTVRKWLAYSRFVLLSYCCSLMVSTIAILLICLMGRLIAIAADAKHSRTMSKREVTGTCQPVPHFSAIKNWNIILLRGKPKIHPTTQPSIA